MNLSGKKLLIMGATAETVKLVKLAESLGVETYVADPYENAAAKPYSSHPVLLNCFDTDAVCELVEQENIDGILPGCADILVAPYEEVARRTGRYCYVNEEIVKVFNNKKGLKEALRKFGLPTIPEYAYDEVQNLDESKYPLFVKPVDNNSSKGMSVAYDYSGFEAAYQKALSFSRSKTVLIEKKMDCDDFCIGYIVQNGEVGVLHTCDRYVNSEQRGVGSIAAALVYPSKYMGLYFKTIHEKVCNMFRKLGILNGYYNFQGFIENGKIMFYDPAARLTGDQGYVLTKHFYGIDFMESLIHFSITGRMADTNLIPSCTPDFGGKYGCNLVFSVAPCKIGRIEGIDFAKAHPNVINITQQHFPGDEISLIGTLQQSVFRMHLIADTWNELTSIVRELQKNVNVYDDHGNNVMLTAVKL